MAPVPRVYEVASYAVSFGAYYAFAQLSRSLRLDQRKGLLGALARAFVGHESLATGGPKDDKKEEAKEDSKGVRALKLLFCIAGIKVSYLCWGIMQERIMTRPYGDGPDAESFSSSKFLVFANRVVALLVADAAVRFNREAPDGAPPYRFSYCATSNIVSSVCQYEALKYVSFPTQVLAKSCKMLPVMIMAFVVSRKAYPAADWAVALAVTGGVLVFKMSGAKGGAAGGGAGDVALELLGYALIVGYMAFDSFTSNWQEALFTEYKPSSFRMMRQVNLFSTTFTAMGLLLTLEAVSVPQFLARHPDCAQHVVLMALCSAVGQLFIFTTIKEFGALVFATVNTVRQMLSVVLSFAVFGHAITTGQASGIAVVFGSLAAQVAIKWRRSAQKKHKKQ